MAAASVGTTFPRWFLISIGGLLMTALAATGLVQLTGIGASRVMETQVAASIDLWFDPQPDGSMLVRHATDGATLEVLAADGGGFMRGVARSLLRQRQLSNAEKTLPFTLSQREDRRFFIRDTELGSKMELDGFGPTNTLSVARILEAGLARGTGPGRHTHSSARQQEAVANRAGQAGRGEN